MRKIYRRLSLLALSSVMTIAPAMALTDPAAEEANMGHVTGRVMDSNKQVLPGASIYIEDLRTGVVSDINGFYMLPDLAPGTYELKISYVGYEPKTIKLVVPENKTKVMDVTLEDGVELQGVEVVGALHGQRKALQMQKR